MISSKILLIGKRQAIKLKSILNYGTLAIPLGFAGFPVYILAPDFYAINYGISLSSLGVGLLFIRLFDAFQDPLIGIISDKYRDYLLLIMGISASILFISIYGLFNISTTFPFVWFFVCMTFSVTSFSILTINLNTLGALWGRTPQDQIRISSLRECLALTGLLVAVSLPNVLENILQKEYVYTFFSLILLGLILFGFRQFYSWYQTYSSDFREGEHSSFFDFYDFSFLPKTFFTIYFMSMLASSIPAVLVIFFVRDLLNAPRYIGIFLFIYFISAILFIPFWNYLGNRKGKYKGWFFSMLIASLTFVWASLLTKGDIYQYGFICLFSGVALGGDLVFPPSIIGDHIHFSKSQNHASIQYGVLNLLSKLSLAFASFLSFTILDYAEFTVGAKNSSQSLLGLSIAYAFIPSIADNI